ncbi:MAG: hypothetical protein NT062_11220, partial [Proteobacteria bacterium]|nr:hypothetical protein [Pseudomonadota bacterium]
GNSGSVVSSRCVGSQFPVDGWLRGSPTPRSIAGTFGSLHDQDCIRLGGKGSNTEGRKPIDDKAAPDKVAASNVVADKPKVEDKPTTPSAPAGNVITSDDDFVVRGTAMLVKEADMFKAAGSDCVKLVAALQVLIQDPLLVALVAYGKGHADATKKLDETAGAQRKALQDASIPGLTGCQNDDDVMSANDKLL